MNDKLLGSKTIVTEHRSYLVDAIGKKGVSRASVSTKTAVMESKDVEVTKLRPHVIARASRKFLQISTTFPVIAHFIPVPDNGDEPELPGNGGYTTAQIYADANLTIGEPLTIAVFDPDLVADKIKATLFNATTGETEYVTLCKIGDGMYRGQIEVTLLRFRGVDFDCIMNASNGDRLVIIYQDGRDASGEPRNITKEITVVSNFVTPKMVTRRIVKADGFLGVVVYNTQELLPYVLLTNERTGENYSLTLNKVADHHHSHVNVRNVMGIVDGDTVRVEFTYKDEYGALSSIVTTVAVRSGEVDGIVTVPDVIRPGKPVTFAVDDPDVTTQYIDLILSGDQSNNFTRLRTNRLGEYVGIYSVEYTLGTTFQNDTSLTLTYTDTSSGAPKLVRKKIAIDRSTVVVTPENPVEVPVESQPPIVIEQMAMQMEINGLFTLNGSFNGIVKLYAKYDEKVRCSIIQAS